MLAVKHSFQLVLREVVLWLEVALQDQLLRFAAGAATAFSAEDDVADHHFAVRLMYIWKSFEVSCSGGIGSWIALLTGYYYSVIGFGHEVLSLACCPVLLPIVVDDRLDLPHVC